MSNHKGRSLKNKRLWFALYIVFYLIGFFYIENIANPSRIYIIECELDQYIPFCEYFIVPYLLWFVFITVAWIYLCYNDRIGFYQYIISMYGGMTLFLIISLIFPNGLALRVSYDPDKNIFTQLTYIIQSIDTPTNVFPSIHVFASVVACVAMWKTERVKSSKVLKVFFLLLTISICLSTLFLRQHSVIDVIAGLILSAIFYWISYVYFPRKLSEKAYIPASEH